MMPPLTGYAHHANELDSEIASRTSEVTLSTPRLDQGSQEAPDEAARNARLLHGLRRLPHGDHLAKQFLGQKTITTNADGIRSFTLTPAQAVAAGQTVTATATDQGRNTSEFSAPTTVVSG